MRYESIKKLKELTYKVSVVIYLFPVLFTFSFVMGQSKELVNDSWQFVKDVDSSKHSNIIGDLERDIVWQKVSLPHTANIEPIDKTQPEWQGICFYKRELWFDEEDRGKHIALQFEGAMSDASVFLNGKLIFRHVGGYLPFYIDISNQLHFGKENTLLVKLDNRDNEEIPPGRPLNALDFNYYSGLYRNVHLIKKNSLYISDPIGAKRVAGGGILLHYDSIGREIAFLDIQTDIKNDHTTFQNCTVRAALFDGEGNLVAENLSNETMVESGAFGRSKQRLEIQEPKLWSPESPVLYTLLVEVLQNGEIIDAELVTTGIRSTRIRDSQLYLNGERIVLRGTNRHQEYPYIGNALSDNAQYRDAWKIKEAGFNFVRTAHYPHSTAFLKACDELGLLVMDAIPGWQFFGDDDFIRNSLNDVRDMVRRDRNHPSVIFWEASLNESGMSNAYMLKAHEIVKEELPFENTYTAGWKDDVYDIFIPARQHAKSPHYWKRYNKNKPILISEYGDWEYYAHNAGFNQKAFGDLQPEERSSRQLRGFGQKRLLQQALNYQESHNDNLQGKILGDANWLMFDYKRGYAEDIESSGIMDIMRLPKFSYYFYQSQRDVNTSSVFNKPVMFIANYWTTPADTIVTVYSNCEEVALFLDDKLVERRLPDNDVNSTNLKHPPFTFKVPVFKPGKLKAVGYIRGDKVAEHVVETYGNAYALKINVHVSGKPLEAGVNDVVFVYVAVTDRNGSVVYDSDDMVELKIKKGDAEVIGGGSIRAEAGIATFLVKAGNSKGKIDLVATANNIKQDVCSIKSN